MFIIKMVLFAGRVSNYKNGKRYGIYILYYKNGNIQHKCNYTNDKIIKYY